MLYKLCIVFFLFTVLCKGDQPCHKVKKKEGFVCTCNAKHCDTISEPKQLPSGQFHLYSTSATRPGFNHEIDYFRIQPYTNNATIIEVDLKNSSQTIRGFGGAFTDSVGYNINSLPKKVQDKLIRSYFSPDGIEYTACRVVLGSCDFSLREYTYLPKYDPSMKSFDLTKDDYIYKIAQIRKAIKVSERKIDFLGTSWYAPDWIHMTNLTRVNYIKDEYKQLWADYHAKAILAFKKAGIHFWGLTTGNEPVTLYMGRHFLANMTAVVMFPEEQRDWVYNNLGPSLKKHGLQTSIFLLDDMRFYTTWWAETVLRKQKRQRKDVDVAGIAIHWYVDQFVTPNVYDDIMVRHPNLELIYSESSFNGIVQTQNATYGISSNLINKGMEFTPSGPMIGSWERGGLYASNIIENLNHWVTTYMDWNLALNTDGGPNRINFPCDSPILINSTSQEFYKQPMFYVLGHFSKFLPPGSVVIKLNNIKKHSFTNTEPILVDKGTPKEFDPYKMRIKINYNLQYVGAVTPKGSTAIVFYNPKSIPVEVLVRDPKRGHAHLLLEANSINTLVYW